MIVADSDELPPHPSAELVRSVVPALDDVRLITTEVYVAAPAFIEIRIEARLFARPEAAFDAGGAGAREALNDFLESAHSPVRRKRLAGRDLRELFYGEPGARFVRSRTC